MSDLIDRQAAISLAKDVCVPTADGSIWRHRCIDPDKIRELPSAGPEPLTDREQRIFLAAMGREEKVCKQVDEECRDYIEPHEDILVRACHEIVRKVKDALWTS